MQSNHRYTEKEIRQILKTIVILCDTAEQRNKHIEDYLDAKKIGRADYSLDFGDYSVMIPKNIEMGILRDLYFDREIVIERKAHLEELSQNLCQKREQFGNEWLRAGSAIKILAVEKGSYSDILDSKYDTGYKSESYFATLLTFEYRYNIRVHFIDKNHIGPFIHANLYYFVREWLK